MARYPGTQFVLRDHSDASAAVPIQQVSNSAPVYMTTFRAPKGPEDMLLVDGQRFYNLYGSQDKIKFNTYKQPLLQASMDINEGARLISKRAVLDSAMLGNATVGVVLSKQVDVTFTKNADGYINAATFGTTAKYVLRPVVVSIKDNANTPGESSFVESKFMYKTHKDTISNEIEMKATLAMNTGLVGVYTSGTTTENIPLDNGTWAGDVYIAGSIRNGNSNEVKFTAPSRTATAPDYSGANTDGKKAKVQAKFLQTVYAAANGGEYFFPLFSIFDNGRGASLKNYAIVFDVNTSKSIGKAVYTLKVADSVTGRTLETYAFTVNPYSRNTNTGYTFDIESAVNLKSDQIKVKYYYDSYDKLMQTINDELSITNEYLFDDADCLFDHDLSGNTLVDNCIARGATADLYSLANSSTNNLDSGDNNITYYYYNYKTRLKQNIFENLRYGSDGVIDSNVYTTTITTKVNVGDVPQVYNSSAQAITALPPGGRANLGFMVTGETATTHQKCLAAINLLKLIPELGINFSGADFETGDNHSSATKLKVATTGGGYIYVSAVVTNVQNGVTGGYKYDLTVTVQEYSWDLSYQNQYRKFFDGQFDRDIFNLDVWFPNCVFDANYDKKVKLAIQKLAAYRGDFFVYLDLNTDVKAYEDVECLINVVDDDNEFPPDEEATNFYIHDRNCAVTSIYGDIRDPYSNKQITVTATYALSRLMVKHFINGVGRPFAGQGYGIIFTDFIEGTVNYIPKIYPSSAMTSRSYIGDTYPSDDETIVNEKRQMTDLKVNYGSYYNGVFTMDTEFTLNPKDSDFSYINNIMLVHQVMQAVRKACPASRYKFIDNNDLSTYQRSVEEVLKVFRSKFAALRFKYVQDENSVANKIYYAAIEVVFRPFAQGEIFTITALNYSTLSSDVTTV